MSEDRIDEGRADASRQVAIVTGGGSGIGKTAALTFGAAGMSIVVADRDKASAEATASQLIAQGGNAIAITADISRATDVERLVTTTIDHFGGLDCAFNNAGVLGAMAPIADMTEAQFDDVIAINLKGAWLSIKYEVQAMLKLGRGGTIVNTSSFVGTAPAPGASGYAASKAALDAMIKGIALEVGPAGIRINNVAPGVTDTPMLRAHGGDDVLRPFAEQSALKRLALPQDIADAALWLCGRNSGFVTGQTLLVDGGYTIAGLR